MLPEGLFFPVSKAGWLIVQPIGLVTLCFAAVLILSYLRWVTLLRVVALAGLIVMVAGGQTNLGRLFLQSLENRHDRPSSSPQAADVAGIIVLGGGFDGHVTKARGGFELGESGDRFVEAVRLARLYPEAPLIISGGEASFIGKTEGDAPIALRFFAAFGVNCSRLILEDRSINTHENAVLTAALLPEKIDREWLLITSAFHMPRAAGAFSRAGVAMIPWPVDYRAAGDENFAFGRDDPTQAFAELSLAIREWIGLAVYRIAGKIE